MGLHCVVIVCLQVAPIAVRGALQSSGQNCAGAERFYVQEPVYEKFVKEVSSIVKSVRMVSFANSLLSWVLQSFISCYL
jgi:acyl-CoA reductase-like NAD-dependent aldehyde dehydrogenase